jgi:hypothetical protein
MKPAARARWRPSSATGRRDARQPTMAEAAQELAKADLAQRVARKQREAPRPTVRSSLIAWCIAVTVVIATAAAVGVYARGCRNCDVRAVVGNVVVRSSSGQVRQLREGQRCTVGSRATLTTGEGGEASVVSGPLAVHLGPMTRAVIKEQEYISGRSRFRLVAALDSGEVGICVRRAVGAGSYVRVHTTPADVTLKATREGQVGIAVAGGVMTAAIEQGSALAEPAACPSLAELIGAGQLVMCDAGYLVRSGGANAGDLRRLAKAAEYSSRPGRLRAAIRPVAEWWLVTCANLGLTQ